MRKAADTYLQVCLNTFSEVSEKKYGRPFNFRAIEISVGQLRGKKPLTDIDLQYFESSKHWWFKDYWAFPPQDRIVSALRDKRFNFWQLPKNEAQTLRDLLDAFKSIELVSIILRFVRPEHYGIISSPVERVLDVRRGSNAVETYLNYIGDLRNIREEYSLPRVADVTMALWVLHERCFGALQDSEIKGLYFNDSFMLRLRAKNLVGPLSQLSHSQLAQALENVHPDLAGLIACYRFEILIREIAQRLKVVELGSRLKLSDVIDRLANGGKIDSLRKATWTCLYRIRNGYFHEDREPNDKQRADLIGEVPRLERELPAFQSQ